MKLFTENNPDNHELCQLLIKGISKRAFITLIASCKVFYEGRATSRLGLGDRTILIKSDGAFIIHQDRNLEPVNWQPAKTKVAVEHKNGLVYLKGMRLSPAETLEVEIHRGYQISYYIGEDSKDLELAGYEADMGDMIFQRPGLIEPGFRATSREYHTPHGYIDIMGKDREGNLTILELKSRKAGVNAVKQLKRYLDCFSDHKDHVRGVLVAPSATDDALEMLEEMSMEFKTMEAPRELGNGKVVTLKDFRGKKD
ncbi:MAG TPA: endonuclease NucS [Methanobacteriaceae archaeon]|nr:endonuclease NucS [Methanobacteriaceae archaeon]